MTSSHKGPRKVIVLLLLLALALPSLPFIPPAQGGPSSRAGIFGCPGSMPPPKIEGIHRGDWNINCEVRVVSTDVPIQGNIIIDFGGFLYIKNVSTVEQVPGPAGPFNLTVQGMTTLNVEKSTLKADRIVAAEESEILINTSTVRSRGGIRSKGGLFTVQNSKVYVYSDSYGLDPKAELNISPKAGFIIDSSIFVQGANGYAGNATALPQDGGEARVRMVGPVVSNSTLIVNGGSGGKGWDSTKGNGQRGARGGLATVDLVVDNIDRLTVDVTSGFGGQGGTGISYMSGQTGGYGGHGGNGGMAALSIVSSGGNITSSTMNVRAGPGGAGAEGGTSKGAEAGDGGKGAAGGRAELSVIAPRMMLYDDNLSAQGGSGGQGGQYGKDYAGLVNGEPGFGGAGGDGMLDIHVYGELKVLASQMRAWGGNGAAGGVGWQYGSDGGSGGNATTSIFTGGNLTVGPDAPRGIGLGSGWPKPSMLPLFSSVGGDGGKGADYEIGGGGDEKYMGHAGVSGNGENSLECLGIADVHKTTFTTTPGRSALGRVPVSGTKTGTKHLLLSAARYFVEDSRSDTTFEGLSGQGLGILRNTTVSGSMSALVWQSEHNATVEIWWYLKVNFTPMFPAQSAEVSFFRDPNDPNPERTCILQGAWDRCTVPLKAEVVTSIGRMMINYTVRSVTDDGVPSAPVNVILSSNRAISLVPGGNFFAPHVNITYPEPGWSITVKDLATGRVSFRGMAWEDLHDPPTRIKDVQLRLMDWRTGKTDVFGNATGVNLTPISSSLTAWAFEIDLRTKDGFQPRWPSGFYHLCARSFDGKGWSDDKDTRRGGDSVCVDISLFQDAAKLPVTQIPNTFPAVIDASIPQDGDYVEVVFDTKAVYDLGASGTYHNFEWDFNSDGAPDWYYTPMTGSHTPRASYVYTQAGIYTARLTLTDINGDVSTVETQVNVKKEVTPPAPPVKVEVPIFCLPSLLGVLIALCLVYLGTVLHEGLKFTLLAKVLVPLDRRFRPKLKHEDSMMRTVSDYVTDRPGRFLTKVGTDLELGAMTLARGVLALEDEGYLVHKNDGTHVRLISTRKKKDEQTKGLRPHQKKLLKTLIRNPWMTATELGEELGRSPAYMSHQLFNLEKKGLVVMTLDPEEGPLYRVKPARGTAAPPARRPRPSQMPAQTMKPSGPAPSKDEKHKCFHCGREVKPNWMLCAYCGGPLRKDAAVAPGSIPELPQSVKQVLGEKLKCPDCGKDIKPKWKLCAYCGTTLRVITATKTGESPRPTVEPAKPTVSTDGKSPKCPSCGKDIKPKWKSCAYCGTTLRKVTASKMDLQPPIESARPTGSSRSPRPVKPKKVVRERLPPPPIPLKPDEPLKEEKSRNP